MKKILLITALIFSSVLSSCATASANESDETKILTSATVKEGYYLSDSDESYIYVSDNTIQVVNFDKEKYLKTEYEKEIASGRLNRNATSVDEFIAESIDSIVVNDTPTEFTIMSFPGGSVMLVTSKEETGNGGGAYFGYFLTDSNTISSIYNYSYAGETPEKILPAEKPE